MQEELKEQGCETSATNIEDLTSNQYVKQLLNSKIAKYFSKDSSSKIALATAAVTLGSFLIRALGYMRAKGYLSVFSMSIEYVDYAANQGFSAFLFESVIFIGLMITTALSYLGIESLYSSHCLRKATYSVVKTKFLQKVRRLVKDTAEYIPIGASIFLVKAIFNALIWLFSASAEIIVLSGVLQWAVVLLVFSTIESICAAVMLYSNNKKGKTEKNKQKRAATEQKKAFKFLRPAIIDLALNTVILSIFLYSTVAYFSGVWNARQADTFSIIEGNYAIIYQSNDYYWTVKAAEENNVLTLNTTTQKAIPIAGVEIEKKAFSRVNIDY